MADTSHGHLAHGLPPVEGDGVNYRGITWFIVILTVTTLFCQALVWGMFVVMTHRFEAADSVRAPLARPVMQQPPPAPNLLTDEAGNLREFRDREQVVLEHYAWANANHDVVRIPVERAKTLVLERGLPARPGAPTLPVTPSANAVETRSNKPAPKPEAEHAEHAEAK